MNSKFYTFDVHVLASNHNDECVDLLIRRCELCMRCEDPFNWSVLRNKALLSHIPFTQMPSEIIYFAFDICANHLYFI